MYVKLFKGKLSYVKVDLRYFEPAIVSASLVNSSYEACPALLRASPLLVGGMALAHLGPDAGAAFKISFREFRDVVFEDVVFDNSSSVTP